MRTYSTGQRHFLKAATRPALISLGLVAALSLGACTTTEGTNAMTDFGTFEREVMTSTLQGFGIVDKEQKEETNQRRAPLVLPKDGTALPQPQKETQVAALPEDSDSVQIDATGLSEEDIKRLRNARVVDPRSLSGRPLTEAETRQLTARMKAAQVRTGPRPLYLPPEEYFTNVNGTDLVCLAADGSLVTIQDSKCPAEIKRALRQVRTSTGASPTSGGLLGSVPGLN